MKTSAILLAIVLIIFTIVSCVMGYYLCQILFAEEEEEKGCKKKKTRAFIDPSKLKRKPQSAENTKSLNNLMEEKKMQDKLIAENLKMQAAEKKENETIIFEENIEKNKKYD